MSYMLWMVRIEQSPGDRRPRCPFLEVALESKQMSSVLRMVSIEQSPGDRRPCGPSSEDILED